MKPVFYLGVTVYNGCLREVLFEGKPVPEVKRMSPKVDQDEADRKLERAQRAVDSRSLQEGQRPRMTMLDDEGPSNAERGTELEAFIEPQGH